MKNIYFIYTLLILLLLPLAGKYRHDPVSHSSST